MHLRVRRRDDAAWVTLERKKAEGSRKEKCVAFQMSGAARGGRRSAERVRRSFSSAREQADYRFVK